MKCSRGLSSIVIYYLILGGDQMQESHIKLRVLEIICTCMVVLDKKCMLR